MTEIIEQPAPWTFTCPVCQRTIKSECVVICDGVKHDRHELAEMRRNFIKVQSAMTGVTRYIEVYS